MTVHQGELHLTGTGTLEMFASHSYIDMVTDPRVQLVFAAEISARPVTDHRPVPGASSEISVPRGNLIISRFAPTRARSDNQEGAPAQANLVISSVAPTVATWTPLDLGSPMLVAWYDATDSVYTDAGTTLATDGQTVRQWKDKSGNGFHVSQTNSAQRPTFRASSSIANNRPAVDFTMFTHYLRNDAVTFPTPTSRWTIYAVFSAAPTGLIADNRIFSYAAAGFNNDYDSPRGMIMLRNAYASGEGGLDTIGAYQRNDADPDSGHFANKPINSNQLYRFGVSMASDLNVWNAWLNGVNEVQSIVFLDIVGPSGRIGVGGNPITGESTDLGGWGGLICEIIVCSDQLQVNEQPDIENYLKSKWGFSS